MRSPLDASLFLLTTRARPIKDHLVATEHGVELFNLFNCGATFSGRYNCLSAHRFRMIAATAVRLTTSTSLFL